MHVHRERRMEIMIAAYAASSTKGANHDTIKRSSKYEQRNSRRREKQMTVVEAIREYVDETEGLEFYEQEPEKGLGILDSYRLK